MVHSADMLEVFKRLAEKYNTEKTFCIDCGTETKPGVSSARCKECWDSRFGY